MPKLFQINVVSNMLSTGKICEDIAKVAQKHGWQTYIAYGRWSKPGIQEAKHVGSSFDMYEHYAEHRLFDNEGLASRRATKKLIKWMDEVKPDIIQLHNIHDHYLNYPILFKYLATLDTPVVWTQHDCWAFTGGCTYFDMYNCWKWKTKCEKCPERRAIFCDKSRYQYELKKKLISEIENLTFVPVSDWLGGLIKESFHSHREILTIHNGIDISRFKLSGKTQSTNTFKILGVAAVWDKRKGLDDFIKLRNILPSTYEITLVGLSRKQVDALPDGINGITRTANIDELVQLYSNSDVFINPTYSDNFPTTNLEALACGTPVIMYRTGGSPEAVTPDTGWVVEQGDVEGIAKIVRSFETKDKSEISIQRKVCRERAEQEFDKNKCFEKYIQLYEGLVSR